MVSVLLLPIRGTYETLLAERLGIDEKIAADIVNDPELHIPVKQSSDSD